MTGRIELSALAGSKSGEKRILVICQGSLETVATLTRVRNQIRILQNIEGVHLHVVWLLNRAYLRDAERRRWVRTISSEWHCPYSIVYSLPFTGSGNFERVASAGARLLFLAAYVLARRIKIVHVHSFCGVQGALLKLRRLLGFQIVLDMQGAHPEEVAYRTGRKEATRRLDARERRILQTSHSVLCVSGRMVDHLTRKHGVTDNNLLILPCCVSKAMVGVDPERRRQVRERFGLEGKFVLVYSGGTAPYQCIPETCELFAGIAKRWPDVVLLVFSWGNLDLFKRCLANCGVDSRSCRFERLEQNKVHDSLSAGDVGLLLRRDELLNRVSSPTKLAEYLAAGLPVVTTSHAGDAFESVSSQGLGTFVDLPPATDFRALMDFFADVRSHREEFAEKCVDYVKRERVWETYDVLYRRALGLQRADDSYPGLPPGPPHQHLESYQPQFAKADPDVCPQEK